MTFGERIAQLRDDRGMTVRQVARLAGMSPSSLIRIEREGQEPTRKAVLALSRALGCHPMLLLDPDDDAPDGSDHPLDRNAEQLLHAFASLTASQKSLVMSFVQELVNANAPAPDTSVRSPEPGTPAQHSEADPRHYVQGWHRETALASLDARGKLRHTAGAQFSKPFEPIRRGDVVWIVYVEDGHLHLIGRLTVASHRDYPSRFRALDRPHDVIFKQREARRALKDDDLWVAPEHLLAKPRTAKPLRDSGRIPMEAVKTLGFRTTAGTTDVKLDDGKIAAQAFRRVRLLAPGSEQVFEDIWSGSAST